MFRENANTFNNKRKDKGSQPSNSDNPVATKEKRVNHLNAFLSSPTVQLVVSIAVFLLATWNCIISCRLVNFWSGLGDFWQGLWDRVLDTIGEDPSTLWIPVPTFVFTVVLWAVSAIYGFFDVFNAPSVIMKYRLRQETVKPIDVKALKLILFNHFVINTLAAFIFYKAMQWRGYPPLRELPGFHRILFELIVFVTVEELGFYYSHRLLHCKFLYNHIHKHHHEYTMPIAIAALHAHPIEHAFSNLVPPFLGVFIMGSHVVTACLWYSIAIAGTLHLHSGYKLFSFPSAEFHDYHHVKINQNFGILGVLDRLHGTDTKFRTATENKPRRPEQ